MAYQYPRCELISFAFVFNLNHVTTMKYQMWDLKEHDVSPPIGLVRIIFKRLTRELQDPAQALALPPAIRKEDMDLVTETHEFSFSLLDLDDPIPLDV